MARRSTATAQVVDLPRLTTTRGICEMTGLHPDTVRRLRREGKLPAVLIGGQWFYDPDVILGRSMTMRTR